MASGIKAAGLLAVTPAVATPSTYAPASASGSGDGDFQSQLQRRQDQRPAAEDKSAPAAPGAAHDRPTAASAKTSDKQANPDEDGERKDAGAPPADSSKTSASSPTTDDKVSHNEDEEQTSPADAQQPHTAKTNPDIPQPVMAVAAAPVQNAPRPQANDGETSEKPAPRQPLKNPPLLTPAPKSQTPKDSAPAATPNASAPSAAMSANPQTPAMAVATDKLPSPKQGPAAPAPAQPAVRNDPPAPTVKTAEKQAVAAKKAPSPSVQNAVVHSQANAATPPAQDSTHASKADNSVSLEPAMKIVDGLLAAPAPKTQAGTAVVAPPVVPPEQTFLEANRPNIISAIRTQLLPGGGTMQLRLDPPELGAMQVTVHMRDGVMTASFETSNDQATRLLSHSLDQLKGVLESQGVQVDKMQVRQQSPADFRQQNDNSRQQQQQAQDNPARQQQQRRDLMQRMWAKLALGDDPLDLTA